MRRRDEVPAPVALAVPDADDRLAGARIARLAEIAAGGLQEQVRPADDATIRT